MKLLLVRHGNTFAAGETPVRVGANEDLPLTPEGEDQARRLAAAMKAAGVQPNLWVAGPLKRTQRHAHVLMTEFNAEGAMETDPRLTEIDYGPWGGLSDAEIIDRFGPEAEAELAAWEKASRWPEKTARWSPGSGAVTANVRALAGELEARAAGGTALVCSSNGILRYFLELTGEGLSAHQAEGKAKMSTGAASLLDIENGRARVRFWNVRAGEPLPLA
ncbi:MAG: histidine phosphatase family protein [Rhodospirillaceae bacterium]